MWIDRPVGPEKERPRQPEQARAIAVRRKVDSLAPAAMVSFLHHESSSNQCDFSSIISKFIVIGVNGECSRLSPEVRNPKIRFLTREQLWEVMDRFDAGPRKLLSIVHTFDDRTMRRWCARSGNPDELTGFPDYMVDWVDRSLNQSA